MPTDNIDPVLPTPPKELTEEEKVVKILADKEAEISAVLAEIDVEQLTPDDLKVLLEDNSVGNRQPLFSKVISMKHD